MRKPLLHLCPCAVHLFGLSPEQTTLRWDIVATQHTLPFIVYWQTPYSAAEHQAKIWCQPLSSPLSWLWHVVRLCKLFRCRLSHAHSHGAACACAPWACSGSIGHGTWNRGQCSASAPSPSASWHTGTCSHPALTWALVDLSWKSSTRLGDHRLGHCRGWCFQTLRTYSCEIAAIRYSRPCQLRASWAWCLAAPSET